MAQQDGKRRNGPFARLRTALGWSKRPDVLEHDHIIILNWSPAIFDLIAQFATANAGRRKPRIVIMAARDKSRMEAEIAARLPDQRVTIICRSGDPCDPGDLAITSPGAARAIIVVSPETPSPDSQIIKTLLALTKDPHRRSGKYRIAAEIRDSRNVELARTVGGDDVQLVLADELMARIIVHATRQPGLSAVYADLLDFKGCQFRTIEQKAIEGSTFGDAMMAYETSTLVGLCDIAGRAYLNPPMETQIQPGMKAVLIAGNAADIKVTATPLNVDHTAVTLYRRLEKKPERILMLGWNRRAAAIAFELSRTVAPGSLLTIAADTPQLQMDVGNLVISGSNLQVEYGIVDTASRAALDGLNVPTYDHVLVLAYTGHLEAQAADTHTLMTLLHLNKIAEGARRPINVVSEMIDQRNRDLAAITGARDFVVSNTLVSLMLARASENETLSAIFADLLDEQGSEIYLRPAELYLELDHPMSFYTVTEACRQRGEVAIGHVSAGDVVVNPTKTQTRSYAAGDRIIVLARS